MAPKSPFKVTNELPCGGREFLESYQFNVESIEKIRSNDLSSNCRYPTRLQKRSGGCELNVHKHANILRDMKQQRQVKRLRRIRSLIPWDGITRRSRQIYDTIEYMTPRCSPDPTKQEEPTVGGFEDGSVRDDDDETSIPPTEDEDALEEENEKTRENDVYLTKILTFTPKQEDLLTTLIAKSRADSDGGETIDLSKE